MGEADKSVEDLDRMIDQYLKTALRANGDYGFVLRRNEELDALLSEYAYDPGEEIVKQLAAKLRVFFENPSAWMRGRAVEDEWLVERAERVSGAAELALRVQIYADDLAEEHSESGKTISGMPPPDSPPIPADDLLIRHLARLGLAKDPEEEDDE